MRWKQKTLEMESEWEGVFMLVFSSALMQVVISTHGNGTMLEQPRCECSAGFTGKYCQVSDAGDGDGCIGLWRWPRTVMMEALSFRQNWTIH